VSKGYNLPIKLFKSKPFEKDQVWGFKMRLQRFLPEEEFSEGNWL